MDEFTNTSELVMYILTNDEQSRNSDNYLFYLVGKKILGSKGIDIDKIGFKKLFLSLKEYGLPQFETVGRIRRKLQHEFPQLSGCESVSMQRLLNEESFNDFSK
ncbi:hypothetical protein [Tepidibacillus decaturensis]|uniref:Uncharacterized protein n=1 Tax=Tepidibacillus decaturensis TaxID=1413211 RepID=A0A135L0W9_9BACI|nr:hypothetical protein [Tepidibacillus decaturensis]KXG42651.1 hypothetical protein U473_00265 [Tepidibacillus decaturensis]